MAKYYNKLQPKLKPWPFIVIGAILLAFVLLMVILTPSKQERFYTAYTQSGAEITKDHPFVEVSYQDLMKKVNAGEKLVVFFGFPTCQVCITEIKYYESELKTQGVDEYISTIYYVNAQKLTEVQQTQFKETHNVDLADSPDFIYFENKVAVYKRADFSSTDPSVPAAQQIRNFYKAINEKQ